MISGIWSLQGWGSTFYMTRELPSNDAVSVKRQVDIPEPV